MIIKKASLEELQHYFRDIKIIAINEKISSATIAGDGNMNAVLRIQTDCQSFICKQSSDHVEKYPQIAAPKNRVQTEAAFYQKIKSNKKIVAYMPKMLGIDAQNNILILEDLGEMQDFSALYSLRSVLSETQLLSITDYLNELHQSFKKVTVDNELQNVALRQLNYEHIFDYPFQIENGFDLDTIQPGLQALSMTIKKDEALKQTIKKLGNDYLESGISLLHGDFYPGSWLNCNGNIKIIDPEFCYFGHAEFDVAVFMAHLYLTKHSDQAITIVQSNYSNYHLLNKKRLNGFIGTEILRRLIGLAQLPLKMELSDKLELINKATQLIHTYNE